MKEDDKDGTEDDPPHPLIAGVIAGDPLRVLGLHHGEALPTQTRAHVQHTQVRGQDWQQGGGGHAIVVEGVECTSDWGRERGDISPGEGETSEVGGEGHHGDSLLLPPSTFFSLGLINLVLA